MGWRLFYERSPAALLFLQTPRRIEFEGCFDLLEAALAPDQYFADEVAAFVIQAQVIAHVYLAFDDLTAAVALYGKGVEIRA